MSKLFRFAGWSRSTKDWPPGRWDTQIYSPVLCYLGLFLRFRPILKLVRFFINKIDQVGPDIPATKILKALLICSFDPDVIRRKLARELKPKYTIVQGILGENLRVNINDHVGWRTFLDSYFDIVPLSLGIMFEEIDKGATFVDVGANIGTTSIPLAKKMIPVLGIEASAAMIHELSYNVALNSPISYSILHLAAASPEAAQSEKYASIFVTTGNRGSSSLIANWNPSLSRVQTELVRLKSLDDIFECYNQKRIGIIKIDVEGVEYDAIFGLRKTLETIRPTVIFEWRPDIATKVGLQLRDVRPLFPAEYQFFGVAPAPMSDSTTVKIHLALEEFDPRKSYENILAISSQVIEKHKILSELVRKREIDIQLGERSNRGASVSRCQRGNATAQPGIS